MRSRLRDRLDWIEFDLHFAPATRGAEFPVSSWTVPASLYDFDRDHDYAVGERGTRGGLMLPTSLSGRTRGSHKRRRKLCPSHPPSTAVPHIVGRTDQPHRDPPLRDSESQRPARRVCHRVQRADVVPDERGDLLVAGLGGDPVQRNTGERGGRGVPRT